MSPGGGSAFAGTVGTVGKTTSHFTTTGAGTGAGAGAGSTTTTTYLSPDYYKTKSSMQAQAQGQGQVPSQIASSASTSTTTTTGTTTAAAPASGNNLTFYPSPSPSDFSTFQYPQAPPSTANISFSQGHHPAVAAGGLVNGNSSALNTPRQGQATTTPATPVNAMSTGSVEPGSIAPPGSLRSPLDAIYPSYEALTAAVQAIAKEQGFGIVKLRSSNYRDDKPTRYDLVCDRGGVKYNSTAKKRNPSTRKIDCPWKAKAVCEVQLANRWRFQVQCHEHNHAPRVAAATVGQDNTPMAQTLRNITNKLDRMSHDMTQGFARIEQRMDGFEKRMDAFEAHMTTMNTRVSGMESRGAGMDVPMDNMGMGGPMLNENLM